MPLLKQTQTTPAIKEAVVLDLADVGAQAAKIRMAAEAQASDILRQAEQKAQQISVGAEAKGYEQGKAKGYEEGYQQGLQQGHDQAYADANDQLQQLMAAWSDVAGQWDTQLRDMQREAKQAVMELALRLSERLVHRVIEVDPTVVVDQLGQVLSHVLRPLDVSVRVHPDDIEILEEALPDLLEEFAHLKHVELHGDATMSRGGCAAAFGQGHIDASIETQLERVIDAMLPESESSDAAASDSSDQPDVIEPQADLLPPEENV